MIVVLDTTKVQIFKQITTSCKSYIFNGQLFQIPQRYRFSSKSQQSLDVYQNYKGCFRYHKGTDFQANHNWKSVIVDFLQLFQIPQRYRFSSKSQQAIIETTRPASCFRYHKGTDFQANHNPNGKGYRFEHVVLDTTKVQIFKQITTAEEKALDRLGLFQIPQRYRFSSKSQQRNHRCKSTKGCFRYHKGTDFQANHNVS